MSAVQVIPESGRPIAGTEIASPWRDRIKQAKKDRERFEPTWATARAFAAGKHWLKWSRRQRRLILPDLPKNRERYTVDEITQYRLTAVGELSHDDQRPTLTFRQNELASEAAAGEINSGLAFLWDEEVDGDDVLLDLKFTLVDLGTGAVRCRFDPTVGPVVGYLPTDKQGKLVEEDTLEEGQLPGGGGLPRYQTVHEGCVRWELGRPENLLVPPGLEDARDFPWEIWVRPVAIDKLLEEYGDIALGLKEDPLASVHMLGMRELAGLEGDPGADSGLPGKLDGHVLVYTCYERPTSRKPKGEMVVLAGAEELRPLSAPRELPYVGPDGTYRSGITYFHYVRVPGRFWGRGLVEVLKDPQRMINKRRTQSAETIDRSQPKAFVEKDSIVGDMDGSPMELIEVLKGAAIPQLVQGLGPGPWMKDEVESCREDLERASGIQRVTLGQNPNNVGTYSQLALLRDSDQIKRVPIIKRFQSGIGHLVEDSVHDMRKYWGREKKLTLSGETEGLLQEHIFDASQIPEFFKVEIPKGAAKPLSQGAKLQMVSDIAQYALNARTPLPVSWYVGSLEAGEPLPLPEEPSDDQREKARAENLMLARGETVTVAYYDPGLVHVPEHRSLQIQCELAGRTDVAQAVERHIQEHLMVEQQKALQQPPEPPVGGAPVPAGPQGPQPQLPPAVAA